MAKQISMNNTEDVRKVINEEVKALRDGLSNPARGNAVANLIGKLLQTVRLDIDVHRYVSNDKHAVKSLNTTLIEKSELLEK